jgi:ribosomal protein S4
VESGGHVKQMVLDGMVTVNGSVVGERRKKLRVGDIVAVKGYAAGRSPERKGDRMRVDRLILRIYRNYEHLNSEFTNNINIFYR